MSRSPHCSSSTCPGGTVSSDSDLVTEMMVDGMVTEVLMVMVSHLPGLPLATPLLLSPPLDCFCLGPASPPTWGWSPLGRGASPRA